MLFSCTRTWAKSSSCGCHPMAFHTNAIASNIRRRKISRSCFGMADGSVRISVRSWRGEAGKPRRRRVATLLICPSACASSSHSIWVIRVLRLYCGEKTGIRSSGGRVNSGWPSSFIRFISGKAVASGSRWVLPFIWLNRQSCTVGVSSHR